MKAKGKGDHGTYSNISFFNIKTERCVPGTEPSFCFLQYAPSFSSSLFLSLSLSPPVIRFSSHPSSDSPFCIHIHLFSPLLILLSLFYSTFLLSYVLIHCHSHPSLRSSSTFLLLLFLFHFFTLVTLLSFLLNPVTLLTHPLRSFSYFHSTQQNPILF